MGGVGGFLREGSCDHGVFYSKKFYFQKRFSDDVTEIKIKKNRRELN